MQVQQEMMRTEVEGKKMMKYPVKQDQQEMARTAVEEKNDDAPGEAGLARDAVDSSGRKKR
jgi:hypothetical protein